MKPQYSYPKGWKWSLWGLGFAFLLAVIIRSSLTWIRAAIVTVERWQPLTVSDFWRLQEEPLSPVLGSLVTLLLALGVATLLINLFPSISLAQDGIYFHGLRKFRFLSWEHVGGFFATRVGDTEDTLLFIQATRGAPWYSRLYGIAVGAGFKPGYLVSSQLAEFRPVLAYVLQAVEAEKGAHAVPFEERAAHPLLAMVLTPRSGVMSLWPEEKKLLMAPREQEALRRAGRVAIIVALALPLLLLIHGFTQLEFRFGALLLLLLGLAEWPLAGYWLVAVGDLIARPADWQDMLAIYPDTQLPRWLVVFACTILVLLGAPWWVLLVPVAAGILWSGWVISLLTIRLYDTSPERGWLGSAVPLVYDTFLYGSLLYMMN